MIRKLVVVLTAVVMLTGLRVPGRAASGSIRVQFPYGQTAGGEVALYWVGRKAEENYALPDSLGGGMIRREDALDPALALWLSAHLPEGGARRLLDADGAAEFTGLGEGLYLVVQTQAPEGWECAMPFLVTLPLEGQWQVQADPKTARLLTPSPQTGDSFSPLFWAMGMILSGMGIWGCVEKLRKG